MTREARSQHRRRHRPRPPRHRQDDGHLFFWREFFIFKISNQITNCSRVCARRTRILKLWAIIETINTNHTITKEDCSNCNETFYRTRVCSSRLYILSKLYRHLDANRKSFHSTPDADMRPDQTQLSERPRRAVKVLPTSTFRDACEILLCFALKLGLR